MKPSKYLPVLILTLVLFISGSNAIPTYVDTMKSNSNNYIIDPISEPDEYMKNAIERNVAAADSNYDKIADTMVITDGEMDLLLMFDSFSRIPSLLLPEGAIFKQEFSSLPVINIKAPGDLVQSLTELPGLVVIEENHKAHSLLAYSTSQIYARDVWATGYTGSSDYSVAILDTGIDPTQSAFTDRIVATHNVFSGPDTVGIDGNGHGTHVAGIAAGLPTTGSSFYQTARGVLPEDGYFIPEILIANVNESSTITIGIDWASEGADNPSTAAGVILIRASDFSTIDYDFDSTGKFEVSYNVGSGDYIAGFMGGSGSEGQSFEGWAEVTQDTEVPSQLNEDGFQSHAGIAFSSNIVSVKVLDDGGSGWETDIINGIVWVIDNKEEYNITVVNMSLGLDEVSSTLDLYIAKLATEGIITVAAAGNDGADSGGIFSPGSAVEAITVGAVNRYNEIAYYSSAGNNANNPSIKPDVLAPGGSYSSPSNDWNTSYTEGYGLIVSPDANSVGFNVISDDFVGHQGTSMASPHIAGLASLLVQKYTESTAWGWTSSDVFNIKRAILAGTYEVANIGFDGGESGTGITDPSPSINRSSKDFYEGWGAVSASAAMGALGIQFPTGTNSYQLSLEDPFIENVKSWHLSAKAGSTYNLEVEVPDGVDVDILVFDAEAGNNGELNVIYSSTSTSTTDATNDESVSISEASDRELMVTIRLVDSSNAVDTITIDFTDPNFIPNIELFHPLNGAYIAGSSFILDFVSPSNLVDTYLDDIFQGQKSSGDEITGLTEGEHNLTLIEKNLGLDLQDRVYSIFYVDTTNPTMTSNLNSFVDIDTNSDITLDTHDNFGLDYIDLLVDDVIQSTILLNSSLDELDLIFNLDPSRFSFGAHIVGLSVYDLAGNQFIESKSINFNHSLYINPLNITSFEYSNTYDLIWDAGINGETGNYAIWIDDLLLTNSSWDGTSMIQIALSDLDIGSYEIKLKLYSSLGSIELIETILIADATAPIVTGTTSGIRDATNTLTVTFEVTELLPSKLRMWTNDVLTLSIDNWDGLSDLIFELNGLHNESTSIKMMINDTSGNSGFYLLNIEWDDLTSPDITSIDDIEFTVGSTDNEYTWTWIEAFQTEVEVVLEKIDTNIEGETIFSSVDATLTSYTLTGSFLGGLEIGEYLIRLSITDIAGNTSHDLVKIVVLAPLSTGTTDKSTPGFISFPISFVLVLAVPLLIRKKRR